jgi:hypothetical protein
MPEPTTRHPASFRDPSGFIFEQDGVLFRQVNAAYRDHYDHLMGSGLYNDLARAHLLIPHREVDLSRAVTADAYKIIQPERAPFVTYPHEWSYSQLRASALVTLDIQKRALKHGMILKDASAYNITLVGGQPCLLDTLSFEKHQPGPPWIAYRQFCRHFLAPLALMHYTDVRLNQLFVTQIDGVPLDLAAKLLPFRSRLNLAAQLHIHVHAAGEKRYAGRKVDTQQRPVSQHALLGLIDNLESAIRKWDWNPGKTAWAEYYSNDSYTPSAFAHKREIVAQWIAQTAPHTMWDLGANTGEFSRLASQQGILTVSMDFDPGTVDLNYRRMVEEGDTHLYPLVIDLTAPSPAIGWANRERASLLARAPADLILALALAHHLAISNNVPLAQLAAFFAGLGERLVVEFVPKSDPKVQLLLANRADIFTDYTQPGFEAAFGAFFTIEQTAPIRDSQRILYLMKRR